jgi:hypothetical protein
LEGREAVASWSQRAEDAVAVTAALAKPFHLDMPVVARAMTSTIQFDHPLWAAVIAVAVKQQFDRGRPRVPPSTKFTPSLVRLLPRGQGKPG